MSDTDPQDLHTMALFELAWRTLREHDISHVIVSFSGEGDSGAINDVCVVNDGGQRYGDDKFAAKQTLLNSHMLRFDRLDTDSAIARELGCEGREITLANLIEKLSDPITNHGNHDWWNNDGGYGEVHWVVDDPQHGCYIEVTFNIRRVETDDYLYELDKFGNEVPVV